MNRAHLLPAALLLIVLAGCGGSVADRDRRPPQAQTPDPPSPFCAAVLSSAEAQEPLRVLNTGGDIPAEQLADTAEEVRSTNGALLAAAPEEIRADVETYIRAVELQLDALVAAGGDGAALARDPTLASEVNTPAVDEAGDRVQAYIGRTCSRGR